MPINRLNGGEHEPIKQLGTPGVSPADMVRSRTLKASFTNTDNSPVNLAKQRRKLTPTNPTQFTNLQEPGRNKTPRIEQPQPQQNQLSHEQAEQPSFFKSISDFEPGDRIWVSRDDLTVPFEGERRAATVLGIKQAGTFTKQATILIDDASDVSTSRELDLHHKFELASLEGQDNIWVAARYIRPGQVLQWWGHEVSIEAVEQQGNVCFLTVTDYLDQKQKRFEYKSDDELRVKIAEPSEEKKAWRERKLAGHMLPPIEIRPDESPEELAKRIMRQMEEWTDN